ncbi:MAG TPA: N-succinylarginine dihydrolase [Humisphaera sp.]|jgi:succinylarginine dihydrolase|nr:N-succinylarginine dihydrolase [Humisphaera sp.]
MADAIEINFDGLVGPTHNYAGLSVGNLASQQHRNTVSHPRQAALQGLAKMKFMADLGLKQAVLPPQARPDLATLRRLGFSGNDAQVLEKAHRDAPQILAACFSASAMWAANAATVSPSTDCADGRVHMTAANLVSQFHRSFEAAHTSAVMRAVFADDRFFSHHPLLPASAHLGDEGAANQMRMARSHGNGGIEIFVYGRTAFDARAETPARFPARQTLEASQSVARLHQLDPPRAIFIQQNPAAIDAGAFHNDVVAVANENVLLYHADAFADRERSIAAIRAAFTRACGSEPILIEVPTEEISLGDAVRSYLFNSQLVTMPNQSMALICPIECQEIASTRAWLDELLAKGAHPIRTVHFVDVRQSMNNGGGPACLRLRVVLRPEEMAAIKSNIFLTDALYVELCDWVKRHYRESLSPDDLRDVKLIEESNAALAELQKLLGL